MILTAGDAQSGGSRATAAISDDHAARPAFRGVSETDRRLGARDANDLVAAVGAPIARLWLPAPPIRRLNEIWDPDAAGHKYRCPTAGGIRAWSAWRMAS
jgi:hypothetical protein